jgi:hypothetical protein
MADLTPSDKCLFCRTRQSMTTSGEWCLQRDVSLGDGRTLRSEHVFVHDWQRGSDDFTSWRQCRSCEQREWFLEAELP